MTSNIFSASCLFLISITPLILRWRTIQHNNKQENKQELLTGEASPTPIPIPIPTPIPIPIPTPVSVPTPTPVSVPVSVHVPIPLSVPTIAIPVSIPIPVPVPISTHVPTPVPTHIPTHIPLVEVEIEIENLVAYAMRHQLFLDQSRKSFLKRHHILIKDLVEGKLRQRNRFRELLLGVKAVGKTEMCKVLRSYMAEMYKQVLTIYISYDASDELLSKRICRHIVSQKNIPESLVATILSHEYASDRIEALELFLEKNNIRLFLLVDEFHFVYKKPKIIGEAIVQEMAVISGTNRGYIHCIVTGCSSCLRSLAFAKLDSEKESDYPSYSRIDLNSTKLQPKWIFPIVQASDFRKLLKIRNLDEDVAAVIS